MGLSAGTRLGPYEIVSPIGAGGMGEVYRARDSKLGRSVAIKVLPSEVARDPEKLGRFQREAKVLASLNHPNIASIYGFEDSDKPGLVMELVEGPTLADRILAGPLSVEEALTIARQVCEALEYAHERRIVHRDVKPANIKVAADGTVKLLDIGLAKALEEVAVNADTSNSPTLTHRPTQVGLILGTAAYMSANPNINTWFNVSDFEDPTCNCFGNAGKNILEGPGEKSADLSIRRIFNLSERFRLEFRTEFFNAFNHPVFSQPDNNIDDGPGATGVITSTVIPQRQIQFALKLEF